MTSYFFIPVRSYPCPLASDCVPAQDYNQDAAGIADATAQQLKYFCDTYVPGCTDPVKTRPEVKRKLLKTLVNFGADGAPAQQNAAVLMKENGTLPNLDLSGREKSHAARAVVQKSLYAVTRIQLFYEVHLIGKKSTLVVIDTSPSILKIYQRHCEQLDMEIQTIVRNLRSSAARFESTTSPAAIWVLTLVAILATLREVRGIPGHKLAPWALSKITSIDEDACSLGGALADAGDEADDWIRCPVRMQDAAHILMISVRAGERADKHNMESLVHRENY